MTLKFLRKKKMHAAWTVKIHRGRLQKFTQDTGLKYGRWVFHQEDNAAFNSQVWGFDRELKNFHLSISLPADR